MRNITDEKLYYDAIQRRHPSTGPTFLRSAIRRLQRQPFPTVALSKSGIFKSKQSYKRCIYLSMRGISPRQPRSQKTQRGRVVLAAGRHDKTHENPRGLSRSTRPKAALPGHFYELLGWSPYEKELYLSFKQCFPIWCMHDKFYANKTRLFWETAMSQLYDYTSWIFQRSFLLLFLGYWLVSIVRRRILVIAIDVWLTNTSDDRHDVECST